MMPHRMRIGDVAFYCAVTTLILMWLFDVAIGKQVTTTASFGAPPSGVTLTLLGTVSDDPHPAGNFIMASVALSGLYHGTIDIFISSQSTIQYGDFIWLKGKIQASDPDSDELPAMFYPQMRVIAPGMGNWFIASSIRLRDSMAATLNNYFSNDKAGLLGAMITGNSGSLNADLKDQMDRSGTTYIIGMYGLKIALLITGISVVAKDLIPKWALSSITLGIVWVFVMVCGGGISVMRAGIMGSAIVLAKSLGRATSMRNILTFTALFMALPDPKILLDAAFQLSFLSFLGIHHLGPVLKRLFGWNNPGFLDWKEHTILSLATNIAIVPIVLKTFGDFSLTSFVSNVFIMLPWIPLVSCGLLISILSTFSKLLAFPFTQLVNFFLSYELWIIRVFSAIDIPVPHILASRGMTIIYYGVLLVIAYYYAESAP